jgi:hypothetical protein
VDQGLEGLHAVLLDGYEDPVDGFKRGQCETKGEVAKGALTADRLVTLARLVLELRGLKCLNDKVTLEHKLITEMLDKIVIEC